MVARILGRLLHMVGVLPTDKVTEVQRTDLVGEFVGHTGPKTRRKVWLYFPLQHQGCRLTICQSIAMKICKSITYKYAFHLFLFPITR